MRKCDLSLIFKDGWNFKVREMRWNFLQQKKQIIINMEIFKFRMTLCGNGKWNGFGFNFQGMFSNMI